MISFLCAVVGAVLLFWIGLFAIGIALRAIAGIIVFLLELPGDIRRVFKTYPVRATIAVIIGVPALIGIIYGESGGGQFEYPALSYKEDLLYQQSLYPEEPLGPPPGPQMETIEVNMPRLILSPESPY